jgi:hypothetical protein
VATGTEVSSLTLLDYIITVKLSAPTEEADLRLELARMICLIDSPEDGSTIIILTLQHAGNAFKRKDILLRLPAKQFPNSQTGSDHGDQ